MQDYQNPFLTYYSIKPTHIALFYKKAFPNHNGYNREVIQGQPKNNDQGRNLSAKSARRLKTAINWLYELSQEKEVFNKTYNSFFKFRVNFITLTIPVLQYHTDNTIKNKCLDYFLTEMRRFHNMNNYVWRAEAQTNGNIHFHIATDTYINYYIIRKVWNRSLSRLGYINKYSQKFNKLTYEEYKKETDPQKITSEKILQARFDYGCKSSWHDPNTTDIHSLKKVRSIAAYMAKYMTKEVTKKEKGEDYELKERRIKGRKWGCSYSLSRLKSISDIINEEIERIIQWAVEVKESKRIIEKFYSVICVSMKDWQKKFKNLHKTMLKKFMEENNYIAGGISPKTYKLL